MASDPRFITAKLTLAFENGKPSGLFVPDADFEGPVHGLAFDVDKDGSVFDDKGSTIGKIIPLGAESHGSSPPLPPRPSVEITFAPSEEQLSEVAETLASRALRSELEQEASRLGVFLPPIHYKPNIPVLLALRHLNFTEQEARSLSLSRGYTLYKVVDNLSRYNLDFAATVATFYPITLDGVLMKKASRTEKIKGTLRASFHLRSQL
ncbi:hypothetical protein GGR51DRAFT_554230 [Nemania sp. FL0031]|nr:hypothetical protein GGR51DRAFT_554230 [Nemania sp. FL0031]